MIQLTWLHFSLFIFPYICSNTLSSSGYGVFVSRLIGHIRRVSKAFQATGIQVDITWISIQSSTGSHGDWGFFFILIYPISTKSTQRVLRVSRGCTLLHGTWSYLYFSGPCLPCPCWVFLSLDLWFWTLFEITRSFMTY